MEMETRNEFIEKAKLMLTMAGFETADGENYTRDQLSDWHRSVEKRDVTETIKVMFINNERIAIRYDYTDIYGSKKHTLENFVPWPYWPEVDSKLFQLKNVIKKDCHCDAVFPEVLTEGWDK